MKSTSKFVELRDSGITDYLDSIATTFARESEEHEW